MNLHRILLRTPVVELRSALAQIGLRTTEDYDELVHKTRDCHWRLSLSRLGNGQLVRCFISVPESRLLAAGLELFNEMAMEGHPVVAYGEGRNEVTFEFEWLHTDGTDWFVASRRVEALAERLRGSLGPVLKPARTACRRLAAHLLEGVLAQPANAA